MLPEFITNPCSHPTNKLSMLGGQPERCRKTAYSFATPNSKKKIPNSPSLYSATARQHVTVLPSPHQTRLIVP